MIDNSNNSCVVVELSSAVDAKIAELYSGIPAFRGYPIQQWLSHPHRAYTVTDRGVDRDKYEYFNSDRVRTKCNSLRGWLIPCLVAIAGLDPCDLVIESSQDALDLQRIGRVRNFLALTRRVDVYEHARGYSLLSVRMAPVTADDLESIIIFAPVFFEAKGMVVLEHSDLSEEHLHRMPSTHIKALWFAAYDDESYVLVVSAETAVAITRVLHVIQATT